MSKTRIGIMGGTFDPIHNGHLILAEYSRLSFNLEKILFIPTGTPPHKEENHITSSKSRYDMTLLAINTNPYFHISSMEVESQKTTYTIDTIKRLQREYSDVDFYFILGSDSFFNIDKWKDYRELVEMCQFIVMKRVDGNNENLEYQVKRFNQRYNSSFHILEAPLIEISSTNIRNRVKDGLPIKYLVPEPVEDYIKKKQLYKG